MGSADRGIGFTEKEIPQKTSQKFPEDLELYHSSSQFYSDVSRGHGVLDTAAAEDTVGDSQKGGSETFKTRNSFGAISAYVSLSNNTF